MLVCLKGERIPAFGETKLLSLAILIKIPQNLHDYYKFKRLILGCQNRVKFT